MKRLIYITLFTIVLSSIVFSETRHSISGRVLDNHGKSISGIEIEVFNLNIYKTSVAKTNTVGEFQLYLTDGEYRANIRAEGFLADSKEFTVNGKSILNLNFKLYRSGSVSGKITSFDGKPVHGSVYAVCSSSTCKIMKSSQIDINGNYKISNIKANESIAICPILTGHSPDTFNFKSLTLNEGEVKKNVDFLLTTRLISLKVKVIDPITKETLKNNCGLEVFIYKRDRKEFKKQIGEFIKETNEYFFYNYPNGCYDLYATFKGKEAKAANRVLITINSSCTKNAIIELDVKDKN